jgi:hypothetical protein
MKFVRAFAIFVVAFAIGCGTPKTTNSGGSGGLGGGSNLPQIAGTWMGAMNFTTLTGSLTFVLSEDASGILTGTASSTPPGCSFSVAVHGQVYQDGQFYVQSPDNVSESFSGTLSNNVLSGNVGLGNGTGCGPRNGTFEVQR